jgi:hypothetical protein
MHFDGMSMRYGSAQRGSHTLDQNVVINVVSAECARTCGYGAVNTMACITRDDVEAACSKLRKMYCFIHKKITPAFAEDGIEKIHPNDACDSGGCSRKLLIHDVPPEMRQFLNPMQ